MIKKRLSDHISYDEATRSLEGKRLGIENIPNEQQWENMKQWAINIFEPLRYYIGHRIFIWSIFRSEKINEITPGASKNSQHMADNGAAGDLDADVYGGTTNREIFYYILRHLEFDQLIGEGMRDDGDFDWVHVSYNKGNNRKEVLTMVRIDGKPTYQKYNP